MKWAQQNIRDRHLIQEVLNGKTNRFAILVDRYKDLVFGAVLAKVSHIHDAEDLAQEAFLKAYRQLNTLEDPNKFGAWLRRISENLALNFLSAHSVRQRDLSPFVEGPNITPPDAELEWNEQRQALLAEIADLNPEQREVILLYYFADLPTLQKVADFLDLPLSTIQGRLEKARKLLKSRLDRETTLWNQKRGLGPKFTRKIMVVLPPALWRIEKPMIPDGIGWGTVAGIGFLLIIGLVDYWSGHRIEGILRQYLEIERAPLKKPVGHRVYLASWEERQKLAQAIRAVAPTETNPKSRVGHGVQAPKASMVYTGQTAPKSQYTVIGFPECVPPGSKIISIFSDESETVAVEAKEDGSFRFTVPYERGQSGFSLMTENPQGERSPPMYPRLDYPLMGGRWHDANERGWFHITLASVDENQEEKAWEAYNQASTIRANRIKHWLEETGISPEIYYGQGDTTLPDLPDSLKPSDLPYPLDVLKQQTQPEDLKIYGYTPQGDQATCIIGENGKTFSAKIDARGRFIILIPHEAVEISPLEGSDLKNEIKKAPQFILNITDKENRLLAATGTNLNAPAWAAKRGIERHAR